MFMTAKQNTVLLRLLATGEELFCGPIIAEVGIRNDKKHIHTETTLENATQRLGYMANHDLTKIHQTLHVLLVQQLKIIYDNTLRTKIIVHYRMRLEGKVVYYGEVS